MSSVNPRDEFDVAGEDMPVGMHRPQPSKWKSVWPFLVILIVVPLLAWGASSLLTNRPTSSNTTVAPTGQSEAQSAQSTPETTQSAPAEQAESAQSEPVTEPESTPTPANEPIVDTNVKISVLNGTGRNGLAARTAEELTAAGFAGATTGNATGWTTEDSTVYYQDPNLEASARAVGEAVGITNVQQSNNIGDSDIVVLLR
ncbi:LytR C-terminal domain-containing protein [Pauljensenia sp. UMB1235]|uniref:LytR C-terminal domain-containing protein n=1 Tax=unclassified Pauljensenia TaxID=2908895 RepID=UPI00254F90E2|nr:MULTISPECIES: LytR C-terminal domain-containing protein [unclassified Pauljensenia]MDK6401173.1 LytR C-terminal domain-containing protein [Pauljensenia sp. UMB9872]MDK7173760.1 LytR C-terminal domain-containing protein [Pauljensenia sp. UMB1235]